jgi:hypothetical protein
VRACDNILAHLNRFNPYKVCVSGFLDLVWRLPGQRIGPLQSVHLRRTKVIALQNYTATREGLKSDLTKDLSFRAYDLDLELSTTIIGNHNIYCNIT